MATLETINFDNLVTKKLPIDRDKQNYVRQVEGACFSKVKPAPLKNPKTVAVSYPALELLDIKPSEVLRPEFVEYFSGNKEIPGSDYAAHCYCGHQFGYFSGQLGDGAAMYIGEVVNKKNERWEMQFKGSGPTPYSRSADGRKVLRSSIREFLCSEAMHYLGIPTTRAGSCVTSDTTIVRDIFYSGDPINERCTVILRIAPTFLRFGSFEIFKPLDMTTGRKGPSVGRKDILLQMLDFTIETYYPEIWKMHKSSKENLYTEFFREVVLRTARLVADWQCVGWCHGVLNTDNMSIVGVTIDYGPYGFIDRFDYDFICNGSDDGGRYSYRKQPEICKWNCEKLAEAIREAVHLEKTLPIVKEFDDEFKKHYLEKMKKKLGIFRKSLPGDEDLIESLLDTMHSTGADFTNVFRRLSKIPYPSCQHFTHHLEDTKSYILSQCCTVDELRKSLAPRMDPQKLQMMIMLLQTNPDIVEHLGGGSRVLMDELNRMKKLKEMENLDSEKLQKEQEEKWTSFLDSYTNRLKQEESELSDLDAANLEKVKVMNENNPKFILRNWIAQSAIEAAEKGDFSEVQNVLKLLETPFDEVDDSLTQTGDTITAEMDEQGTAAASAAASEALTGSSTACSWKSKSGIAYDSKPPDWAQDLRVT